MTRPTETELRIKRDLWSLWGVVYALAFALVLMWVALRVHG